MYLSSSYAAPYRNGKTTRKPEKVKVYAPVKVKVSSKSEDNSDSDSAWESVSNLFSGSDSDFETNNSSMLTTRNSGMFYNVMAFFFIFLLVCIF